MAIRRELTLEDYLAILRRRCWLIIIPTILAVEEDAMAIAAA